LSAIFIAGDIRSDELGAVLTHNALENGSGAILARPNDARCCSRYGGCSGLVR